MFWLSKKCSAQPSNAHSGVRGHCFCVRDSMPLASSWLGWYMWVGDRGMFTLLRSCGAGLRINSSRRERHGDGTRAVLFYKVLGYTMALLGENASSLWVVAAGGRSLI